MQRLAQLKVRWRDVDIGIRLYDDRTPPKGVLLLAEDIITETATVGSSATLELSSLCRDNWRPHVAAYALRKAGESGANQPINALVARRGRNSIDRIVGLGSTLAPAPR